MRIAVSGMLPGLQRHAWFSDEDPATYRARLDIGLGFAGPPLGFLLHNPSTAGHLKDDPTSLRVVGFGRREKARRVTLINPVGYRAADKSDLVAHWRAGGDIVGPSHTDLTRAALLDLANDRGRLIVAWGKIDGPQAFRDAISEAIDAVLDDVRHMRMPILCLGTNADGSPKHPLYLAAGTPLVPWRVAA